MKIGKRDLDYQVVVRRVAVGPAPFRWEVHNGDAFVPLHVSEDRYRGMEAAFKAGQAWLANLVSLSSLPPGREARRSFRGDPDFRSGPLSSASVVLDEDEDDELELDDNASSQYSDTIEGDGPVTMPNKPSEDEKS